MRTAEQLLDGLKHTKAQRIKLLEHKSPAELVRMLELMGHFDTVNSDIAWLENYIRRQK